MMVSGMCAERQIPFDGNPLSEKSPQVSRQERACCPGISRIDLNLVEAFLRIEKIIPGGANRCIQGQYVCSFRRIAFADVFVVRRTWKNTVRK